MSTNIRVDDDLIASAQKVSIIKTTEEVAEKALQFVQIENQKKMISLWGKVAMDDEAYQ